MVPRPVPNPDINFPYHLLSTTLTQFYLPEHKAMGSNAWKKLGELSAQVQNIVSKDKESGSPCKKLTCPPGTRRLIGWSLPPRGRERTESSENRRLENLWPAGSVLRLLAPTSFCSESFKVGRRTWTKILWLRANSGEKSWLTCNGTNSRQLGVGWGGAFQVWKSALIAK